MSLGTRDPTIHGSDKHDGTVPAMGSPGAHATTHKDGGSDEVATATAGANAIPKAGAGGTLAIGFIPTGSSSSTVCIGNDSRLSDARTPTAHAPSHAPGDTDAIATGTTSVTVCIGNDSRLSDSRTPLAHSISHKSGGSDEVATATAATNSIPRTGLSSQLATGWLGSGVADNTKFLRGDSTWAVPTAAVPDMNVISMESNGSQTIATQYSAYIPGGYEVEGTDVVELAGTAILEVG